MSPFQPPNFTLPLEKQNKFDPNFPLQNSMSIVDEEEYSWTAENLPFSNNNDNRQMD